MKRRKPKSKLPVGFIELGEHYGYPPCCIAEFVDYVLFYVNGVNVKRPQRKFHGTGYVPCAACNEKPKDLLLANIATNRKHSSPFPNGD